jgi:hypothetical protein
MELDYPARDTSVIVGNLSMTECYEAPAVNMRTLSRRLHVGAMLGESTFVMCCRQKVPAMDRFQMLRTQSVELGASNLRPRMVGSSSVKGRRRSTK